MIRTSPVILYLIAISCLVFFVIVFADSRIAEYTFYSLLLIPERFDNINSLDSLLEATICLFGHSFLHISWAHFTMNMFAILAFGTGLTRLCSQKVTLFIYLASVSASAVAPILRDVASMGASGGFSGMVGALCAIAIFQPLIFNRNNPNFRHSSIISLSLFWIAINIVIGLFPELVSDALASLFNLGGQVSFIKGDIGFAIAWDVHIIGFLAGFIISSIFSIFPRYFLSYPR